MRWHFIAKIIPALIHHTLVNLGVCATEPFNNDAIPVPIVAPSFPIVIPKAIDNVTATIVHTPATSTVSAKTYISFDDGPMVAIDDELRLQPEDDSLETAYNKYSRNMRIRHLEEPTFFDSPFADPICVYNDTIVRANVTGPTTLFCSGPDHANDGNSKGDASTPLHISSMGNLDARTLGRFAYLSSLKRSQLQSFPSHGPSSGGTRIVIKHINNTTLVSGKRALCRIGTYISHAIEVGVDSDYVVCVAPPWSTNGYAHAVSVDVSVAGPSNFFSGRHVVFRYDGIYSLSSLHPPSGLIIGGTKVKIHGGPFIYRDDIKCSFGEQVVKAVYHDNAQISCISPHLGWIEEVQRVSVFTMAASPEIQAISATVDDYINEVHICSTVGTDLADDELGRGFRLVAPGGSIQYPLSHHTRWLHFNETGDGMKEALSKTGRFPSGFHVDRKGPFSGSTYTWEIVLPKNESFDGETLHVVNTGGGAVKLTGTNASVTCTLALRGTKKLDGTFKLLFVNGNEVESSIPINHNATNDEIKQALEALNGIDRVNVNSMSLDSNRTDSGAFQWHITFDSLKNAGDVPLLTAQYSTSDAQLLGSNAAIDVREIRKGSSNTVYRIDIPSHASRFSISFNGIESEVLPFEATAVEVLNAIESSGGVTTLAVERHADVIYFLDIIGNPLEGRLKASLFNCTEEDTILPCTSDLLSAVLHVPNTTAPLGGHFSLRYPSFTNVCKQCVRYVTEPISVFSTATQVESALQKLDLVDGVKVVITESGRFGEYKVSTKSGIVGHSRNFYIRFVQTKYDASSVLDDDLPFSTGFTGDVPLLEIVADSLQGTPTRDGAYSIDYTATVSEVVKGTDLNHGGSVQVSVSINGGVDYSADYLLFEYNPVPIVHKITPAHGSINGRTAVRIEGYNFRRQSARFCLFWDVGDSMVNGTLVPISKYQLSEAARPYAFSVSRVVNKTVHQEDRSIAEVLCMTPASLKPRIVYVTVVSSEHDASTLGGPLLSDRGKLFRYHDEIKISDVYPLSSLVTGNVSVVVFGGPFISDEGLFCAFGKRSVPGIFLSPNQIKCITPPHAAGTYSLEVTQNGQDFTKSGHVFRYQLPHKIIHISPASGPWKRAGTNVKVIGENFVNSPSLQCRFGLTTVPAAFVSNTEILCAAPPIDDKALGYIQVSGYYPQRMRGSLVSFAVTNNGQDFTSGGHEFFYTQDIQAFHLSRREGPSRGGGTPVILSGENFVNSTQLTCRFGKEATPAFFLTHDAVLCFSPPFQDANYGEDIVVPLAVSNNAADYVFADFFTYTAGVSPGLYQAGTEGRDTLLSCPRGAYCDGILSTNFTLCSPGTYQNLTGQAICDACPIGYMCNEFGLTLPRICPQHYLCDEAGLSFPKPCPTNYICNKGTATLATDFIFGDEICFDNSTDDFGLQASSYPKRLWSERHLMPLDVTSSTPPIRGRFCRTTSRISYRDATNFQVSDRSFDYSSTGLALRRPLCVEGTDCKSEVSPTSQKCSKGHYCRNGRMNPCRVGTYCPHDKVFDPLLCEPGTFNYMVGQVKCSECPIGYYCPAYGLSDPLICSAGFVCSRKGLVSPNLPCPAGFYCLNGTKTSDPFRNDTTLRPYACSPGTFCVAGTGYNEVKDGFVGYAQPCTAGFFCEAASPSAKGSGACPPSFQCPKGTATPHPTPKGYHAEHPGTIESSACLPGFYAPTIQSDKCHPCPPGTSCSFEGLFAAEDCGPGTYRSTHDDGGNICVPCPQGTWSKNWGLREKGECTRCPTGVVCPIDGMTRPCSYADLPTPYEPLVNYRDMPAFEYDFPADSRPPPFSIDECFALNTKLSTEYFYSYGELVPPYIDILGRGPHFRASDQSSLKYQSSAKCYKNSQPHGSLVYQRMADYYGPQYDIQTGHPHQGYGIALLNNQIYATAPPNGFDYSFTYYRGEGNGYIDLPKARVYDPTFNCTHGLQLMNSSLVKNSRQIVYTDPTNDFEGGVDVKRCPTFDENLGCYIDPTYELHTKGDCCRIETFVQRAVYLAHDQFYKGTCEADLICTEGGFGETQAKPCDSGFVCDEKTSLESSDHHRCPAGFVCDFATTPDTNLYAPASQLKQLCTEGHYCGSDNPSLPRYGICPENHWCPTGTSDPYIGSLANDGLLRLLHKTRMTPAAKLKYDGGDIFVLLSDHDNGCNTATHPSLKTRFKTKAYNETNVNYINYLSDQVELPITVNEATAAKEHCARDNKSSFIRDAMRRRECNCHRQFLTLAKVYRFWKCKSNIALDDLGFGDATMSPSERGMRDFWYPYSRIHKLGVAFDPAMEVFGLIYGDGSTCNFSDSSNVLSLVEGRLPDEEELPNVSTLTKHYSNYLDININEGLSVRYTSAERRTFASYAEFKDVVGAEYHSEREQIASDSRSYIDPHIFDLYISLKLIEQFGQKLEEFVYLNATNKTLTSSIELVLGQGNNTSRQRFDFVGPLDWCECQNLLRCPNATLSDQGSTTIADCVSTKDEVLHRISLLPPVYNSTTAIPSTNEGSVDESSTVTLKPYEVAILTIDQSQLPSNLTYGDHYRIAIYDGCKPCPIRYRCKKAGVGDKAQQPSCLYPSMLKQGEHLNECLKQHRKPVCFRKDGFMEEVATCRRLSENGGKTVKSTYNSSFVLFTEPDLEKCLSRPYFCSDTSWNFRSYRRLCQDDQELDKSPIYNCSDVQRWQTYANWRNTICCSQVPELQGIDSCHAGSFCVDNPLIENIIREKLISMFESEYGFIPPAKPPKGELLMNASLQEEIGNDHPFDLFTEYQKPYKEEGIIPLAALHNENNPESSSSWMTTPSCCECHRHSMSPFFASNALVSGFPDDKHQVIQLAISALVEVELTVVVELMHGAFYSEFADYYGPTDKTLLRVHSPSRFGQVLNDVATWLAVMEKKGFDKLKLDLPLNLLTNVDDSENILTMENRFLVDRQSNSSVGDSRLASALVSSTTLDKYSTLVHPISDPYEQLAIKNDKLWPNDFIALPYLPFFSSCDGYDSHISLSRLLEEHPDCLQVSIDQAVPASEFSGASPVGDKCLGIVLNCAYEEDVREARTNLRWYEASPGSTLFHITRDAVPSSQFVPSTSDEEWGRTSVLHQLREHGLIPVSVGGNLGGYRHAIPRKIKLELKYFQVARGDKRLVDVKLYYDDLCTTQEPVQFGGSVTILDMMQERGIFPCDVDINGKMKSQGYNLEIQYYPLIWFELVNDFEFGGSVYSVFFAGIGSTVLSLGGVVYAMNRLCTKLRHPPQFMGLSFVKLFAWPQIVGISLAVVPYTVALLMVHSLFYNPTVRSWWSNSSWLYDGKISEKEQIEIDMGRLGSALIVLGFYSICRALHFLIPSTAARNVDADSKTQDQTGSIVAKRANFIWIGLSIEAIMMCVWEFSYSDEFRNNIFRFKVLFQLLQVLLELVASHVMGDRLLAAPLLVSIQMAELLVTMGARNFVEFTLCYLVEVSMMVFQRLFLNPLIKTIMTLWPRWRLMLIQLLRSKGLTRQEQQARELRWKKVNEDIELRSEGVEPLLDSLSLYSVEKTGSILFPFMCFLVMFLYTESEMAKSYDINRQELLYYGLFAFFMIPWMALLDCFIFSSQELLYGWRVFDYFSYQRWRFANRENGWNLFSHVDESVNQLLQGVDLLCFSSQYYFILSIIALGFGTNMMGITICLRKSYNFLGDPSFPFIVAMVVISFEVIAQLCIIVSSTSIDTILWYGIWNVTKLQGTMDDVIASKLAIGEGRQEDLEQERQELLAMNSESFRHAFIEKNRPWVLSHLVELIIPDVLQDVGSDGRPVIDYLRDIYSTLMNVGKGVNQQSDDHSYISSDDYSDDEEEKRRQWDRTPLEGNKLLIAQIWIQKARKRHIFTAAVEGLIEKRKEDHCTSCSRAADQCKSLTAGLDWNNKFDHYAIDNLIKEFEDNYSSEETSLDLWKAFFRENARYSTCCNICLDQIEQQKRHKDVRRVGAGVVIRPGDISSDDELDDGKPFGPVIVVRSSDEGKMMSKWLQGAREKLGGEFPRSSAAMQTEQYLEKLKYHTPVEDTTETEAVDTRPNIDEIGEVIVKRWLADGRKEALARFEKQSIDIRSQLQATIGSLDAKDSDTRIEGRAFSIEGDQILKQKVAVDSKLSEQLAFLRVSYDNSVKEIDEKLQEKKEDLDTSLSELKALSQGTRESRKLEINKLMGASQSEVESVALQNQLQTELEDEERLLQLKIVEMNTRFAAFSKLLDRERHSTLQSHERECILLTGKSRKDYMNQERDWQKRSLNWIGRVNRMSQTMHKISVCCMRNN